MKLTVGQNIRTFRKARGLTQEQLAEAVGVTIGAVSKWEADLSRPELELLIELADFFELSVDVLLGYEWQVHSTKRSSERIQLFCREKRYDEGCREAEKALQKYVNSFEIIYQSANLYYMKGLEQHTEEDFRKALKLYRHSLDFLQQNTDEAVSEPLIYNRIAEVYVLLGETDTAISLFKKYNYDGINSGKIGLALAYKERFQEALPYLSTSMFEAITEILRDVVGYVNFYFKEKNSTQAIAILEWTQQIVNGLKLPGKINFANKMDTLLLTLLAIARFQIKDEESAKETLLQAKKEALLFDASPDCNASGLRFYYGEEQSLYDDFGATAMEGIEKILTGSEETGIVELWSALNAEGGNL